MSEKSKKFTLVVEMYAVVTGVVGAGAVVWIQHKLMVTQARQSNQAWRDYDVYHKRLRKEGYDPREKDKLKAGWVAGSSRQDPGRGEFSKLQKSMQPILFPEPWRRITCWLLRVREPDSWTKLKTKYFEDCCFHFVPKASPRIPSKDFKTSLMLAFELLDENNDPVLGDMVACLDSIPRTPSIKYYSRILLQQKAFTQTSTSAKLKELLFIHQPKHYRIYI